MVTGQEIIGKSVESRSPTMLIETEHKTSVSSPDEVYLEDVRTIEFAPGPNGQIRVGLIPWMISATDATITIKKHAIVASVDANGIPKQMIDMYLQDTSGLQIANAGALK